MDSGHAGMYIQHNKSNGHLLYFASYSQTVILLSEQYWNYKKYVKNIDEALNTTNTISQRHAQSSSKQSSMQYKRNEKDRKSVV